MENLYSGRTNLSSNLKPLQVTTDAKAKLEEISDKYNKQISQISDDEQRRAKRIGNWKAVSATDYRTAMSNLDQWNKAFNGLGKGLEAFIEHDARDKQKQVLEGGHTFESDPLNYTKLLEHGELLKALEKGQIKSQETAEKLKTLGLTEAAERYVSLSDYNRRGVDFAYMQNKASTADAGWLPWLEKNQAVELESIGTDGKPQSFTVGNYNELLRSQQQQITSRYANELTKDTMLQYDAATREKYLLAPIRTWQKKFLDNSASKSTKLRARDHIESKTQLLQTHVNEALVSKDWSVARSALINWRAATKFQWGVLEAEGALGSHKSGELMAAKQEELMEEILTNAGHKNANEVLNNLILPVLAEKQFEQIPVTNAKGEIQLDDEGKVVYKKGKQILPFGESLQDHRTRFQVKEWKTKTNEIINKSYDKEYDARKGVVESYINNKSVAWGETPPAPGELQQAVNDFTDEYGWATSHPELMKKLQKLREWKPSKLSPARTTQRLEQLHARYGKIWPSGELGNLDRNSEQVENYMEVFEITQSDAEFGTGMDKVQFATASNRLKDTFGHRKNLGFDRKNGEAVYTSAWLAVQIKAQQLKRDYEKEHGVKVSDSKFLNDALTEELKLIELGANDKNSQYFKTSYGYENYNKDTFFNDRGDLISPKYESQIETYRKQKAIHGIGGLKKTYFLQDHPELLEKTKQTVSGSGQYGVSDKLTESLYHPVLAVMARDMGVLPGTLWESQVQFRDDAEQLIESQRSEKEKMYIEENFPKESLLDLNNMQRLGVDKTFLNRTLNQTLDFPWGSQPLEDLLGDWPAVQDIDKDQAFLECKEQPNRGLAFRTYCRTTRPGIDIATENRIINHLHSMGVFNV